MTARLASFLLLLVAISSLLTACNTDGADTPSGNNDAAVNAVMRYLEARVATDRSAMQAVSCAAWEAQAGIQAESFRSMNAQLEDVVCTASTEDGATLVTCEGQIVTSYNGENRSWPLPVYSVTQEDGDWKVCGEAER